MKLLTQNQLQQASGGLSLYGLSPGQMQYIGSMTFEIVPKILLPALMTVANINSESLGAKIGIHTASILSLTASFMAGNALLVEHHAQKFNQTGTV